MPMLVHVKTLPEYRQKGVSTELLSAAVENCRGRYNLMVCSWDPNNQNTNRFFDKMSEKGWIIPNRGTAYIVLENMV